MSDDPLADLERALKPYRGRLATHARLPQEGVPREQVLADLELMADAERERWQSGQVSGAVYEGEPDHIAFLNAAYALHSQSNPLHLDVWPSAAKMEAEIVSMTAGMLGADLAGDDDVVGTVTSGGTESIMLAMRAYQGRGRAAGIENPVMVLPETAHAAFDKAAQAFGIEQRKLPVTDGFIADPAAVADAIDERTVVVVGSAPAFPHGLIDPIEELSEIARERGVGFHTDGCLGGFILPWAARLGYDVPPFDFRLPGVTSMSADTHKFGYAAKGTSVVLYRGDDLRHHQYFTFTDWPGGLYATPTFAGSRPGGLSAACWAAMVASCFFCAAMSLSRAICCWTASESSLARTGATGAGTPITGISRATARKSQIHRPRSWRREECRSCMAVNVRAPPLRCAFVAHIADRPAGDAVLRKGHRLGTTPAKAHHTTQSALGIMHIATSARIAVGLSPVKLG